MASGAIVINVNGADRDGRELAAEISEHLVDELRRKAMTQTGDTLSFTFT